MSRRDSIGITPTSMLSEAAVFGGATGALVVGDQQRAASDRRPSSSDPDHPRPAISGSEPQQVQGGNATEGGVPQGDLTVNYVPLDTTNTNNNGTATTVSYTPAVIHWRPATAALACLQ